MDGLHRRGSHSNSGQPQVSKRLVARARAIHCFCFVLRRGAVHYKTYAHRIARMRRSPGRYDVVMQVYKCVLCLLINLKLIAKKTQLAVSWFIFFKYRTNVSILIATTRFPYLLQNSFRSKPKNQNYDYRNRATRNGSQNIKIEEINIAPGRLKCPKIAGFSLAMIFDEKQEMVMNIAQSI